MTPIDSALPTVGVVGLGIMGMPMAGHVRTAGFRTLGVIRNPARAARAAELGIELVVDPAALGAEADIVLTVLPDSPDVREVLFGERGAASTLRPGTLVIDASTISPEAATLLGKDLAALGIGFVDAPISGGEAGAIGGSLAVMVGGSASDVAQAMPILETFGGLIRHVGPSGSGQIVKVANQILVAGHLALTAEALTLLHKADINLDAAVALLGSGLAASRVLERKSGAMRAADFTPGFRLELHRKDLRIAMATVAALGTASPLGSVAAELIEQLCRDGFGSEDHSAIVRVVAEQSGLTLPFTPPTNRKESA